MEQRIKGQSGWYLRYDPETAKLCGADGEVSLYRKKSGEYFLHENGNIKQLDYEEAKAWAKNHLAPIEYSRQFEDVQSATKCVGVYFKLPENILAKLKRKSSALKKSQTDILCHLINKYL